MNAPLSLRDTLTSVIPLRLRLWLKTSALAFAAWLKQPTREGWRLFCRRLALHPLSAAVTGRAARRLAQGGPRQESSNLRLTIFLMPCCWTGALSPLVQLGDALRGRGFDVHYVSGHAGCCSYLGTIEGWTADRCAGQLETIAQKILGRSGTLESIGDYVTPEIERRAEEWLAAQRETPILDLAYAGWSVWEMVKGSYARLRSERINPAPGETAAAYPGLDGFLKGFVIACETVRRYLESTRPDAVMIFNGLFYQERLISELARAMGIRVIAHENSSFADRRIFDTTGYIGNYTSVAAATWPSVRARVLTPAQRARLEGYLAGVYQGAHNTIGQARPADEAQIREKLGLAPGQRLALLLGQVPCDTVIVYDLRIFDTLFDFMARVIETFRALPDVTLVVRMHPWESEKFGDRTYHQLRALDVPPNVRFVRGRELNTYDLMRLADFGITATSQAGLEMLSMRKPVVVAGDAFYARKGFTVDVPTAGLLEAAVREMVVRPVLDAGQQMLLERFLYHVIFEHQVPFDRENALYPPEAVDRIEAMARGIEDWRIQNPEARSQNSFF